MSQYGSAAKNPPWVRSGQAMGLNQTSQVGQSLMGQSTMSNMTNPSMLQYPQVFQGQMAAAQQMYGAVQYPTRALNSAAFNSGGSGAAAPVVSAGMVGSTNSGGQQHASNINDQNVSSSNQAKQQRVFTGTVTKVQDNFGFVDNDVFFQSSCCVKGSSPQVGDRVLVEAVYNSNMPFKWNATRIQVLHVAGGGNQQQSSRQPFGSSGAQSQMYSAVPPPSQHNDMIGSGGGGGGGGGGGNSSSRFSSRFSSNDRNSGRDRSRDIARDRGRHQQRDQEDDRKRRREDSRNRNERDEKDRGRSPARKRSKSPQRNVARRTTQQRRAPPRYSVVVPKISLASREADVIELRKRYSNLYIPSDFFLSKLCWTDTFPITKPLSLDLPCNFHVMHKDVDPLEEINADYEPSDADYLYSAKVMLFSSPGLDGLYSKCCRGEDHSDGKSTSPEDDSPSPTSAHPSRLLSFLVGTRNREFLAIGGPWSPSLDGPDPSSDPGVLVKTAVRTCKALTGIDLSACTQWFRFLEVHYHRSETTHHGRPVPARVETVVMFVPDVWSICPSQLSWDEITAGFKTALNNKLNPPPEPEEPSNNNNNSGNNTTQSSDEHKEEESPGSPEKTSSEPKKEPKHHSELDPKNMREESESKEKKKMDEREKMLLEKRYRLPDTPHIIVHPNRTFKAGKFDCSVVSLSALLGYRQGDTKEHAFEVSLFAELFNEMLMRDFGFNIYKAVLAAPERPKEEKNRDKDEDKTKDKEGEPKDKESKDSDKDKDKSKSGKDEKKDKEKEEGKMEVDEAEDENTRESTTKKEEEKKKEVKKVLKIMDQNLLLSFTYFDTTRGGYIYDRDLEDLLFSLGLALSRSQLRKLVQKVATKDSAHYTSSSSVHYRKIAEKTKEEGVEDDNTKEQAPLPDELIFGNKMLLPSRSDSPPGTPSRKRKDSANTARKTASGMVEYNGTLVDIGKLMDQLSRSEHTRVETEKSLAKLRTDYNKLKESSARSERYIKDLTADIKDYKERLYNSNSELCTVESKQKQFYTTLSDIQEMIRPLLKSSSHSSNNDPDVIEVKREDNGRPKRRKIDISSTQPTEIVEIKEDDPNPGSAKQEAEASFKPEEK
ncbi:cell division cycle and apoptosis regulator protein 1-like isoform X5 [Rhodnius prolixus]|uniref:cell division cycle and apoptosis regulator protein 1-like isoform X5 n=1 Tax=Rhodnius prolixus TaxID=13249 RepID=UPI003D187CC8